MKIKLGHRILSAAFRCTWVLLVYPRHCTVLVQVLGRAVLWERHAGVKTFLHCQIGDPQMTVGLKFEISLITKCLDVLRNVK
jgi:hypothetical protein